MPPYMVYRADTRKKSDPTLANGFQARVPLTVAQAISLVQRCDGKATANMAHPLPDLCTVLKKSIEGTMAAKKISLLDLAREIKREKSQTTVHISTDVTQGCGGFDGVIYEMVFPALFASNGGPWAAAPNPITVGKIKPSLILDTQGFTPATSLVAVAIYGAADERTGTPETTEVAFLTGIPRANMRRYSSDGGATWKAM